MSWSMLSEDLWKHILLHVPLEERLGSCSRVNTTLYRAAAAATQQIQLCQGGEAGVQRLPGVCHWLLQHGHHLTNLRLSVPGGTLTQLPCPNLRELNLRNMQVQLSGSSTHPGVLHSCTRLTRLLLQYCQFADGHSSLAALSSVVRLQHLNLTMGAAGSGPTDDGFMPSTALQHLTQLTYLSLQYPDRLLSPDSLQHTSCLANLQELDLFDSSFPLSPSTSPGWSSLTALRKVRLQHAILDPSILQDCTLLQDLELQCVTIISAGGAAALHNLLGHLQQLQSLHLFELEYDWHVAAAAYSSLTASSALHKLCLSVDDMPPGVWPHVFPPDRQLPALRELTLCCYDWGVLDPPPAATPGTDDISCLARCCPGLDTISSDVQPGTLLSDLTKVSGLTSLRVTGQHAEGFESLEALSELVSLQKLSVFLGGPITPQDLLCLTTLTGLTRLCIDPNTAPEFEGAVEVEVDLAQTGMPRDPPVWLQLLEHCGQFSECQPLIFNSMGQQLLEQQQRYTQQEQQLAAQQQQIAELQAELATTRAEAAAARAAASAAASAAAAEADELRGRLQALEGQMQQLLQAMLHPEG